MARTGFGSRLLFGQRATGLVGRIAITGFVLMFGFGLCAVGAVFGVMGMQEALDPDATMYRLQRSRGGSPRAGVVRAAGTLSAEGVRSPLCEVVHEHYVSGKNGGWRRDASWSRSAGARFEGHLIAPGQPVVFDPLDPTVVAPEVEEWFRDVLADVPAGGRLRAHCVASGERVFVEGCVVGGVLDSCPGYPLTVTTGDGTAQPRIDAHASAVAGRLAGGAGALVAGLAYLWYVLRARPLADALLRRVGAVPAFTRWPLVLAAAGGATLCALAQGVMVWTAATGSADSRGRPGYLIGLLVFVVATVMALLVRHRRQNLDRAMAPVREAETVPLRDARGGVVELAVRVRDGGAPVAGVLDGRPHAWAEVRVEEVTQQGKQTATRQAARRCWPGRVPVEDASGAGWLDLTHAELDLRSSVTIVRQASGAPLLDALARTPIGPLRPSATHLRWIIEESVLDPGESLYVLGQCRRVEDPHAAGSYRADSTMAVVGGTAADRVIAHAGSERSLLRLLGVERGYLDLLTAALAGVAASLAVTMLALWAL